MTFRDHEEGGADGYFASVSDLMVGILFVFLLMLTVFALNYRVAEHDREIGQTRFDIEKHRADHLRALLEQSAGRVQQDIEAGSNSRDRLLTTLETTLSQRGIQVWVDPQAGILHLPGDLLFGTLSATLGAKQRDSVGILANALAQILPCFTPITDRSRCDAGDFPLLETVLVEGHTDRRPIGNAGSGFRDNDQLSTERALAVFAELRRARPSLDSLRNADRSYPLLGVSGYGGRRPLPEAQANTEADYDLDRRIDLRFLLARTAELGRLRSQLKAALTKSGE